MTLKYNHMYTIAFSVDTPHKDDDVTERELLIGLSDRLKECIREDCLIKEAVGKADDTYTFESD